MNIKEEVAFEPIEADEFDVEEMDPEEFLRGYDDAILEEDAKSPDETWWSHFWIGLFGFVLFIIVLFAWIKK